MLAVSVASSVALRAARAADPGDSSASAAAAMMAEALPRVPPREPSEALDTMQIAPGYRLELAAAEPLVVDPVAMAFDERGRLFVVEMCDYSEQATERLGRVRLLTDDDGDGAFDRSEVFAADLSWPTAVICSQGGVYVAAAPDILFLRDADGDDKADERRVVFSGFGRGNVQGLVNSFQWGLDGRIYVAVSSSGASLRTGSDPAVSPLELSGRDFAFDPRTFAAAALTGGGQHGQAVNRWGDRFVCSNSDHLQAIVFEDRYLSRNPYFAPPGARRSIATDGPQAEVYRRSPVEPWRVVRTKLRVAGIVPGMIEGGGRASGYFTSATGVTIDEGGLFAEPYALVADVGSNLIHRKRLVPDGVTYRGERIDERCELVASTDNWFRPVQMGLGPEGAIYIADMYREVIEHPESLPPELKRQLDLTSGRDRGRIYRLVPADYRRPPRGGESFNAPADLVKALESPNLWRRTTAARLLRERDDRTVMPALRQLAASATSPQTRVTAFYLLSSWNALDDAELVSGLKDGHPQVRRHCLILAERRLQASSAIWEAAVALRDDPAPIVRFQLALSLGECDDPRRGEELAKLLASAGDRDIAAAALTSAESCAGAILRTISGDKQFCRSEIGRHALTALAGQIARQLRPDDVEQLAGLLNAGEAPSLDSPACLALIALGPADELITAYAAEQNPEAGARLQAAHRRALALFTAQARKAIAEAKEKDVSPTAAQLIALAGDEADRQLLGDLLAPDVSPQVNTAVLQSLGRRSTALTAEVILGAWPRLTPAVRQTAAETLALRASWVGTLLDAIEAGEIPVADVPAGVASALANYPDELLRKRFAALQVRLPKTDRQGVFQDYREVLSVAGDESKGRQVFSQHCTSCHQLQGEGRAIGPNLAAMANRGAEALLLNILAPNNELDLRYAAYIAISVDGRALSGMIAGETATSVSLQTAGGELVTLLRADLEELHCSGESLMPEGFERVVPKPAMADLLAYIMAAAQPTEEVTP